MRTRDFSSAPRIGQASAQFVGGTSFRHPFALIGLYRRWIPMVRRMKHSPGYCGHRVWWRFPFIFGTIAWFETHDSLLEFARTPEHADIMQWVMQGGNARGGFIRLYEVQQSGYTSGIWRAEPPHVLKHIDRFSPLVGEELAPRVVEVGKQ